MSSWWKTITGRGNVCFYNPAVSFEVFHLFLDGSKLKRKKRVDLIEHSLGIAGVSVALRNDSETGEKDRCGSTVGISSCVCIVCTGLSCVLCS